jgi:hypothetical protein
MQMTEEQMAAAREMAEEFKLACEEVLALVDEEGVEAARLADIRTLVNDTDLEYVGGVHHLLQLANTVLGDA